MPVTKLFYPAMRTLALIIFTLFFSAAIAQKSINEIEDNQVVERILLVRHRTDSLLAKMASPVVFKKFTPDFGTTYLIGEVGNNYLSFNKHKVDPKNIYELTQYARGFYRLLPFGRSHAVVGVFFHPLPEL
jgi:hypothetical protein